MKTDVSKCHSGFRPRALRVAFWVQAAEWSIPLKVVCRYCVLYRVLGAAQVLSKVKSEKSIVESLDFRHLKMSENSALFFHTPQVNSKEKSEKSIVDSLKRDIKTHSFKI